MITPEQVHACTEKDLPQPSAEVLETEEWWHDEDGLDEDGSTTICTRCRLPQREMGIPQPVETEHWEKMLFASPPHMGQCNEVLQGHRQ